MTLELLIILGGAIFLIGRQLSSNASKEKDNTGSSLIETMIMIIGLGVFMLGCLYLSSKSP